MKASTGLDPSQWREEDDGMVRSQPSGILEQECLAFQFPGFEPAQRRNSGNHKLIQFLKRTLKKAWEEITPEMVAAILKNFQKRLDARLKVEGGHFECS
ncbi:hypothetical protein L596_001339 [Steinernema carpocapsae]|uniref:Uncharacterized protein n=1 Tax=Steinernema carpocapsae TaxID=34508 RepID=A0A4U8UNG7_STECR|nr:hypothetical protein L596_001339 [Steinernema carpocapsae]